jgi:hypothetical protein
MRVACFCGAVFEAEPPAGMCPECDAAPVIFGGNTELSELVAAYEEGLAEIRALPEVTRR